MLEKVSCETGACTHGLTQEFFVNVLMSSNSPQLRTDSLHVVKVQCSHRSLK